MISKEDALKLIELSQYKNDEVIKRFLKDHTALYNLNFEEAESVFEDLKLLLFIALRYEQTFKRPYLLTDQVCLIDSMWHTFLLFTVDYKNFCLTFFGKMIEHLPERQSSFHINATENISLDEQINEQFQFTKKMIGADKLFIWNNPKLECLKKIDTEIKRISSQQLDEIQLSNFNLLFQNRRTNAIFYNLSDSDKDLIQKRISTSQPEEIILGAYFKSELIAWCYGRSTDFETMYMQNSAVISKFQNKGVYSALLDNFLKESENQGYQVVASLHHPNNSAVLIPKLKKGFVITGTQFHEKFGFLIEMKYFVNKERRLNLVTSMGLAL